MTTYFLDYDNKEYVLWFHVSEGPHGRWKVRCRLDCIDGHISIQINFLQTNGTTELTSINCPKNWGWT